MSKIVLFMFCGQLNFKPPYVNIFTQSSIVLTKNETKWLYGQIISVLTRKKDFLKNLKVWGIAHDEIWPKREKLWRLILHYTAEHAMLISSWFIRILYHNSPSLHCVTIPFESHDCILLVRKKVTITPTHIS